jgi:hypothetical protein
LARADLASDKAKLKHNAEVFQAAGTGYATEAAKAAPDGLTAKQKEAYDKQTVFLANSGKAMSALAAEGLKLLDNPSAGAKEISEALAKLLTQQQKMQQIQDAYQAISAAEKQRHETTKRMIEGFKG